MHHFCRTAGKSGNMDSWFWVNCPCKSVKYHEYDKICISALKPFYLWSET